MKCYAFWSSRDTRTSIMKHWKLYCACACARACVCVCSGLSLGSLCAPGSPVAHVQSTPLSPVSGEGRVHVAVQAWDGPDHQVVHWKPRETTPNLYTASLAERAGHTILGRFN